MELEEKVQEYPEIGIQVSKSEYSYTVHVTKPDCMEVIGEDIWMLRQPAKSDFPWLYRDKPGPLFVRKWDREICEKVIFPTILNNPNRRRGNIITGTPGIGKSMLTNWVIAMIRSYFKDKDIYLFDTVRKDLFLIQSDGRCFKLTEEQYEDAVKQDKNAIVLVDTGGRDVGDGYGHAGYIMVTASPKAIPTETVKEEFMSKAYLPVWEWKEVQTAFNAMFPVPGYARIEGKANQYEELERRFKFAGGVPRILFGEPIIANDYEDMLDDAIADAMTNFRTHISLDKNVHKVFHITVLDILNEYETMFATLEIQGDFNLAMREAEFEKAKSFMVSFFEMNFKLTALQPLAGACFEILANEILALSFFQKVKAIEWKRFKPKNGVRIGILAVNHGHEYFDAKKIDEYKNGMLYVSRAGTQPVIDSWTKKGNVLFLFQITKQKKRQVGDKEIKFFNEIIIYRKEKKKKHPNTVCLRGSNSN